MNQLTLWLVAALMCASPPASAQETPAGAAAADCVAGQPLEEAGFVMIGGIEQWVTITGEDCANPVILFVHGGPGNPMSPFADSLYGGWADAFTLVQWDQRGAGRTFGRNPGSDDTPLSVDLMARDGVEVAAWLTERLHQPKVILMGGSWGSALAAHMVKARPELFHAYVGSGQLVSGRENLPSAYRQVAALARAADDAATLTALETLGPPPWINPRGFGILRRATRIYEARTTTPAPSAWWVPAPAYATSEDEAAYEGGEEFSYIQFMGMEGDGMLSRLDLTALGPEFEVPVFLIQGAEDLVTTPEVSRRYFDSLIAPDKAYVLLPAVGHDPNQAMVDAQYDLLTNRIVPLIE